MSDQQTAAIAKSMFGPKPYQQRAQLALPILVRQAMSRRTITYQNLAAEMGLSNHRLMNYVLGSVGTTLVELSEKWQEAIPPIQCLAVNKGTGLPGEGIDTLLAPGVLQDKLPRWQKTVLVEAALVRVFSYPKWPKVLRALQLPFPDSPAADDVELARHGRGGGESEEHRRLKESIRRNPVDVGLPASVGPGESEYGLPSGDSLDVLFRRDQQWVAVEVKSRKSSSDDLARGLFQCVKYQAVLKAWRGFECDEADIRVMLALEGTLPNSLQDLRNSLGVEVVETVPVRKK